MARATAAAPLPEEIAHGPRWASPGRGGWGAGLASPAGGWACAGWRPAAARAAAAAEAARNSRRGVAAVFMGHGLPCPRLGVEPGGTLHGSAPHAGRRARVQAPFEEARP